MSLTGKLLAFKAISIAPRLSGFDRQVAGALIDHLSEETGQLNPSVRCLAFELDSDMGSVSLALRKLCDPANQDRLFDNENPGRGRTPRYRPRWDRYRQIADQLDAKQAAWRARSHAETVRENPNSYDGQLLGNQPPTVGKSPSNCSGKPQQNQLRTNEENQEKKAVEARARPAASDRGTRIPPDYKPDVSVAMAEGLSMQQATKAAANFVDYWTAKPGSGGRKVSWDATWRVWCRNETKGPTRHVNGEKPPRNIGDGYAMDFETTGSFDEQDDYAAFRKPN